MSDVFNPKPAEDYPTLLKQFNALVRLHRNGQIHVTTLQREVESLLSQIGRLGPGEADSQRDANAELTTLLEQQEVKLSDKDKELARLRNALAQSNRERDALREELLIKPGTGQTAYRAAADIYYQLVQECEIPEGGSLVTFVENLLEEATKTVMAFREGGKIVQGIAIDQLAYALDATNQGKDDNGN